MYPRSTRVRLLLVCGVSCLGVACKGEVATSNIVASASGGTPASTELRDAAVAPQAGGGAGQPALDAGSDAAIASDARVMDAAPMADANTRPPEAGVVDSGAPRDAATGDTAVADAAPTDAQVPPGDPVIVAVGYLGLRVMSADRGRSWGNKSEFPNPGGSLDNPLLLRCVAYGNGLFVAAGHRIWTSPDGIAWTERDNPQEQWFGGVQWGNNRFVAAGGYGETWYSDDGVTWHAGGKRGNNSHARAVAFGDGEFRASTDDGNWWRSSNGESWSLVNGGHSPRIAYCEDEFRDADDCPPAFGHGVYIEGGEWDQDTIRWSEDGDDWNDVDVDYVGSLTGVAFGFN